MSDTLKTAESLLGDLTGFQSFKKQAADLHEELKLYQSEQFESWSSEMQDAIGRPHDSLRYFVLQMEFTFVQ